MTTKTSAAIIVTRTAFQEGYTVGLNGGLCVDGARPWKLEEPVTEELIVSIIRNLCEIAQEGWLSESLLRRDAGQIAGWLSKLALQTFQG